jgi:hypothetical protein
VRTDVKAQDEDDKRFVDEDDLFDLYVSIPWGDRHKYFYEYGIYYPGAATPAERFQKVRKDNKTYQELVNKPLTDYSVIPCVIHRELGPIEWESPDGIAYTVQSKEKWVTARWIHDDPRDVLTRIEALAVTSGGFKPVVIERETDRFRKVGPMFVPHRTRQRMSTDGQALPEIVKVIIKVSINERPPTQAEIAAILAEAMGNQEVGAGAAK